jgi:hypothetical protein
VNPGPAPGAGEPAATKAESLPNGREASPARTPHLPKRGMSSRGAATGILPTHRNPQRPRDPPHSPGRATRSSPHENKPVRAGRLRVVVAAKSFARQSRGLHDRDRTHPGAGEPAAGTAESPRHGPLARPVRGFTCTHTAPAEARMSSRGAATGNLPTHRNPRRPRDPPHSPGRATRSSPHENKPVRAGGLRVVVAANSLIA